MLLIAFFFISAHVTWVSLIPADSGITAEKANNYEKN
jgi:hypothetical protein